MVDFSTQLDFFIYLLDLFGTMAFAVTGAFKAIEHKADIIGIIIFNDTLTISILLGGSIVVASGIFAAWRTHIKSKNN